MGQLRPTGAAESSADGLMNRMQQQSKPPKNYRQAASQQQQRAEEEVRQKFMNSKSGQHQQKLTLNDVSYRN